MKVFENNKLQITHRSLLIIEYNLMCERGKAADNSVSGLYRRLSCGHDVSFAEVRLVIIAGLVGCGLNLAAATERADMLFEFYLPEIFYGLAEDLLKPLFGVRQRLPAIDLAEHAARKPRALRGLRH